MVSIITAIYNQLDMNRLYLDSLRRHTDGDWELIVIDNGSSDGSREMFETAGENVRVIANEANYSYPYSQNQGLREAKGDIIAFFNNDMILSPHWDTRLAWILGKDGNDVLTLGENERRLSPVETRHLRRRWKWIKYPMIRLFGSGTRSLKAMMRMMYGDWEKFADRAWQRDGVSLRQGFVGSAVVMTRRGLKLLGEFDPTIQAADFDLYMRAMHRARTVGDIKPMRVVGGVLHHHFGRLTFDATYPEYADGANLRSLESKWGDEICRDYLRHATGH